MSTASPHYAIYGNSVLERSKCEECGEISLIVDGRTTCCGKPVVFTANRTVRMSASPFVRRSPPKAVQREILTNQSNRCYYCERRFWVSIVRHGRLTLLRPVWDHYIPFAYLGTNPATNFVAACQVCNGFKSSMMFATREEAQLFLRRRWAIDQSIEEFGDADQSSQNEGSPSEGAESIARRG